MTQTPALETVTKAGDQAPWIVMVHGVSQNRQLFSAQQQAFEKDYRLLLIDLPGHGESSDMSGPYGLVEFAAAIEAAMDSVGITCAHFWGTHLGAGAGLLLAARSAARFKTLILEGPVFPGKPLPAVASVLDNVRRAAREQGMNEAKKVWFNHSQWFAIMREHPEECRAQEQWQIVSQFQGAPWLDTGLVSPIDNIDDKLATLTIPTLIINGEHDLSDFLDVADQLERALAHCERASIIGGGGFPLWEYPEPVNTIVRDFMLGL